MAKRTSKFRRPRRRGRVRAFAAWLVSLVLVLQFWTPALYASSGVWPAPVDPSYARFVRIFGDVPICAAWTADRGLPETPAHKALGRDPFQCPICQSIHLLGGLAPAPGVALAAPGFVDSPRTLAVNAPRRKSTTLSSFDARGPPPAV